tara:strand:+ start:2820 stop:2978 length:159 start_codon:yes stop_codon:yes gene_type:complete
MDARRSRLPKKPVNIRNTAQKARKQGGLAAAKNFSPRQRLRNQRFQSRQQIK